jgi:trimeric autotransporter adhesin
MKKILIILIGIAFSITILNSQVAPPQAFSYKATIINKNGAIIANKTVSLRIGILQGSTSGTPVYSETFHPTTNEYGQIDILIDLSGTSIDWSIDEYFLETEVDVKGGINYQLLSVAQLLSVPYALYAGKAGNAFSGKYSDLIGAPVLALVATTGQYNDLIGWPSFAPVATSGSYNDLTNKPITDGSETQVTAGTNVIVTGVGTTADPYIITATGGGSGSTDMVTITGDQTIAGIKTFTNDLLVNGLTVGRGINSMDMNTAIGNAALSTTTGNQNTAVGFQTLSFNTTGAWNTANGAFALWLNTTGFANTAFGGDALGRNQTGNNNTATGFRALRLSTGDYNTANGSNALSSNTTGSSNTAIGNAALSSNITGSFNVAIGEMALFQNTSGGGNTAAGRMANFSNTEGSKNTAYGGTALAYNQTGNMNTAIGYDALQQNTASYNTAVGCEALGFNTSGHDNTANGFDALYSNTTGWWNSAIGRNALYWNTEGYRNTALGLEALFSNKEGYHNTALGYGADVSASNLSNTTVIGANAKVSASNTFVFGSNEVVGWGFGVDPSGAAIRVGTSTSNGNGATLTLTGVWTNASDITKKYDIKTINYGLNEVMKLHPVTYKLKGTNNQDIGFIAQEVKKIVPEIIYGPDGQMTMSYGQLTSVLVKAVQEQQKQIEAQQKQIDNLKKLVGTLLQQ